MSAFPFLNRALAATAAAAMVAGSPGMAEPQRGAQPRSAQPRARVGQLPVGAQRPTSEMLLSIGEGELVNLPASVTNVWTSNPGVADVYVSSPRQIHLFGKAFGEATIFATSASGAVVYSTTVRVSQNVTTIDRMLKVAMPDANITVTMVGQLAVLTGTVGAPEDVAEAARLVTGLLNPGVNVSDANAQLKIAVINRLKTATPLQVNLQVKFAEVSRSFVKNIGVNTVTRDTTNGFQFGLSQGRTAGVIGNYPTTGLPVLDASSRFGLPAGSISLPFDPKTGNFIYPNSGSAYSFSNPVEGTRGTLGLAGKILGLDILSAIDLGERIGQVTTLANPNLTALSGETGTFLAGGEIPIPINQGLGTTTVEYKQYGVSLAYTPTVLSDGRISLRVRPEVSQISSAGAVQIEGTTIPALTTRRAETTVELGSGQSFMIAGLLQNSHDNSIDKIPGAGDIPILGALFRSNGFQRNETELVIVITPYLVKPVNAADIKLPTDGYEAPDDIERVLMGQLSGKSKKPVPKPTMEAPADASPAIGAATPVPMAPAGAPQREPQPVVQPKQTDRQKKKGGTSAAPGFNLN